MKCSAWLAGLLSALALPAAAHALGEVIIGNERLGPNSGYGKEVLAAINIDERVYLLHHDWYQSFYFKGGPKALNDTMRRFAAIPADKREIRLLAVPGKPLSHDKPIPYDWHLRLIGERRGAGGRHIAPRASEVADDRATLTVYIPHPLPPALADPKAARKWIADLDRDDFRTRDRAARELAALGTPVAPLLRDALQGKLSAEARERVEKLRADVCTEIRLDVLDFPPGVPVVGVDDLLARARRELANKDPAARGDAAGELASHGAPAEEILPDLEKLLKTETDVSPLAGAAWGAIHLGAAARPLLPALRGTAGSSDVNVAGISKQAIAQIEKASKAPVPEAEVKRRATIRKEVREFLAGLEKESPGK